VHAFAICAQQHPLRSEWSEVRPELRLVGAQVPAAPAIDEESVAEQLVAQTREKGIGAGRPERVAQQSHQAGVGGRAGGGDVVGVAEDAGFEPARACTQPAFQVRTGSFASVPQRPSLRGSATIGRRRTSANDPN
jgi:hypothetical protein